MFLEEHKDYLGGWTTVSVQNISIKKYNVNVSKGISNFTKVNSMIISEWVQDSFRHN